MDIDNKDLEKIRNGLKLALAEIHNKIATCPDVAVFAEDLTKLELESIEYICLLKKLKRR